MATPPPSRYLFESEMDFQIEMALWCAENEPRYFVSYLDETAQPFGEWKRTEVESLEAAHALCAEKDLPEDHPFIVVAPGGRTEDAKIIRLCGENADDLKVYTRRQPGERMGGLISEYKSLGLR